MSYKDTWPTIEFLKRCNKSRIESRISRVEIEGSIVRVLAVEFAALGCNNPNQSGLACTTEQEYSP